MKLTKKCPKCKKTAILEPTPTKYKYWCINPKCNWKQVTTKQVKCNE